MFAKVARKGEIEKSRLIISENETAKNKYKYPFLISSNIYDEWMCRTKL